MNNPDISLAASSSTSDSFLSDEVLNNGGFLIYILILVYCCFALAVICDAYFVPSLQTLSDVYDLPPDIAGSTLMALGASVPELFASLIGVFVTEDDIGTAVPAACAFVAAASFDKKLTLTPFPIIRNSAFYSITILILVLIIKDNSVDIPESIILMLLFFMYMGFMIYSAQMQHSIGGSTSHSLSSTLESSTSSSQTASAHDDGLLATNGHHRALSLSNGTAMMTANNNNSSGHHATSIIGAIDHSMPLYPEHCVVSKASSQITAHCPAWAATYFFKPNTAPTTPSVDSLLSANRLTGKPDNGAIPTASDPILIATDGAIGLHGTSNNYGTLLTQATNIQMYDNTCVMNGHSIQGRLQRARHHHHHHRHHEEDCWVTTKWIMVPMLPITVVMRLLTPFRQRRSTCTAVWTFIVSIVAIGMLTYVTVWMVHLFGQFMGLSETIAGITILSWGTGIPELIASIVLIKKTAQVDMAICNAIGSNVIDISFCLSLPWLIKCILNLSVSGAKPVVKIQSAALPLTTFTLLITVVALIVTLKCHKWQMTVRVGLWLSAIYVAFVVSAIALECLYTNSDTASSFLRHLYSRSN
ncbi:Sodium/potassium/calcium exchanger 3 [Fragariocoptes setiger]|uniref:Sodium/potassium/calcium exchanger 3 n=1 Tax=Fragariocoptes setiger TaxID=1670756 RepID=A0ABQ7SBT0_9ACAR|nr:Sodium/potassium/calcium exchanger 3 [Fragariocoptes setiger]